MHSPNARTHAIIVGCTDCSGAVWCISSISTCSFCTRSGFPVRHSGIFKIYFFGRGLIHPMIIWIILQDEISVQVSADGTRLSVSEYKKTPEIDFSLWLQFLFVFFPLFSVCVSHFAADASGISGGGTAAIKAFFPKPSSQRAPRHTATVEFVTVRQTQLALPANRFMATNGANKDGLITRFLAGEPWTSGISSLILRRVWRHVPAWLLRSKSLIISVRKARKRRDDVQEGRGEMRPRGGGLATAISSF